MGGRAAEEVIFGDSEVTSGASGDIEAVTRTARNMVTRFGMSSLGNLSLESNSADSFTGRDSSSSGDYSEEVAAKIDREIRALVEAGHRKAREIIQSHRELVDTLTDLLLDKETIDGDEFRAIVARATDKPQATQAAPVLVAGS
jgi:cell division protease FtsH